MALFNLNEKLLLNFAVEYQPPMMKLGAPKILTQIPVDTSGGNYVIKEAYVAELMETKAGDYSETPLYTKEIGVSVGTFQTETHRLKTRITKEEVENLNEIGITNFAMNRIAELKTSLLVKEEYLVHSILSATPYKTSPSTKWDTAGATIEADIRDAVSDFVKNANIYPNKLIIPQAVWDKIMMDETLRNVFTFIPARKEQTLDITGILAQLFSYIQEVIIVDAKIRIKKKGAAVDIWGDDVYLVYSDSKKGDKSTFTAVGKFIKEDWQIKRYTINDPPDAEEIILYSKYDIKEICPTAIYKIENVLT